MKTKTKKVLFYSVNVFLVIAILVAVAAGIGQKVDWTESLREKALMEMSKNASTEKEKDILFNSLPKDHPLRSALIVNKINSATTFSDWENVYDIAPDKAIVLMALENMKNLAQSNVLHWCQVLTLAVENKNSEVEKDSIIAINKLTSEMSFSDWESFGEGQWRGSIVLEKIVLNNMMQRALLYDEWKSVYHKANWYFNSEEVERREELKQKVKVEAIEGMRMASKSFGQLVDFYLNFATKGAEKELLWKQIQEQKPTFKTWFTLFSDQSSDRQWKFFMKILTETASSEEDWLDFWTKSAKGFQNDSSWVRDLVFSKVLDFSNDFAKLESLCWNLYYNDGKKNIIHEKMEKIAKSFSEWYYIFNHSDDLNLKSKALANMFNIAFGYEEHKDVYRAGLEFFEKYPEPDLQLATIDEEFLEKAKEKMDSLSLAEGEGSWAREDFESLFFPEEEVARSKSLKLLKSGTTLQDFLFAYSYSASGSEEERLTLEKIAELSKNFSLTNWKEKLGNLNSSCIFKWQELVLRNMLLLEKTWEEKKYFLNYFIFRIFSEEEKKDLLWECFSLVKNFGEWNEFHSLSRNIKIPESLKIDFYGMLKSLAETRNQWKAIFDSFGDVASLTKMFELSTTGEEFVEIYQAYGPNDYESLKKLAKEEILELYKGANFTDWKELSERLRGADWPKEKMWETAKKFEDYDYLIDHYSSRSNIKRLALGISKMAKLAKNFRNWESVLDRIEDSQRSFAFTYSNRSIKEISDDFLSYLDNFRVYVLVKTGILSLA